MSKFITRADFMPIPGEHEHAFKVHLASRVYGYLRNNSEDFGLVLKMCEPELGFDLHDLENLVANAERMDRLRKRLQSVAVDYLVEIVQRLVFLAAVQAVNPDIPICATCTQPMRPAGSIFVCESCGSTLGSASWLA